MKEEGIVFFLLIILILVISFSLVIAEDNETEECSEISESELCPDEETLCPQTTDENECIIWDCDSCEAEPEPEPECTDSDGGKEYYIRGTLGISCSQGECPIALCGSVPAPGEPTPTCLSPSDWCADESVLESRKKSRCFSCGMNCGNLFLF
ncbi:MAG: hypothetical protein KJ718_00900 [Nanoarchaeota archaeon]|nr:hypothetical protein [Nanoarchaeota archaeon]MBU1051096.1 hypothetical protein [Nanoarchaeota archaeon]